MNSITAPDLTIRPPRSPRIRLDGYSALPRILDKARATLAGKAGDYIYGNPLDQSFFTFTGVSQADFLEKVAKGAGDWEMALWIRERSQPRRAPYEVKAWSDYLESAPIGDAEDHEWFAGRIKALNPSRTDLRSVVDYLDFDDHVSFGGAA